MSDTAIVTLICGFLTFAGTVLTVYSGLKKNAIENAVRDQKLEDSIDSLSRRVDEHNGIMDKVTEMSADMKSMRTDLEWLKKEHQK